MIARIGSGFGSFQNSTRLEPITGLMGALQATYSLTEAHAVSAGIRKSFFDSFFTNAVSVVSIQGGWNGKYGDRLSSTLNLGTRFESYDGPTAGDRRDQVTRLNLGLQYNVNSWSNVGVRGGWLQRSSPENPQVEYDDINAGVNATFTY